MTTSFDVVATKIANWIQDREYTGNARPAFIHLSKNAASLDLCLATMPSRDYNNRLPNHPHADRVWEAIEVLSKELRELDLCVMVHFESAGIMEKGDMESTLIYAAAIIRRTAELVAAWRGVESAAEGSPEETGSFPIMQVG